MSDFDLHGSHIPVLVKAITQTHGAVLELGMGWNSTPLLHWLCTDQNRPLVSHETDPKWASNFTDYKSDLHSILVTPREPMVDFTDRKWGVVLVDGRPAKDRHKYAIQLANFADIVIVHDAEEEINRFYRYDRVWPHFRYKVAYTRFKPHTVALSNSIDIGKELA